MDKPRPPQPGVNRNPGLQGVSGDNFGAIFAMHTHDGTPTGGRQIYLPIFARDTANGHTYRIDCTNGVLTLSQLT